MATIKFTMYDDLEGTEIEIDLPAKYDVCTRCEGEGKHVDPAIDGNGISQDEFDEDPDFEEGYFAGHYDVPCEQCGGKRVELVVDAAEGKRQSLEKELEAYYEHRRDMRALDAEMRAERRMGA